MNSETNETASLNVRCLIVLLSTRPSALQNDLDTPVNTNVSFAFISWSNPCNGDDMMRERKPSSS